MIASLDCFALLIDGNGHAYSDRTKAFITLEVVRDQLCCNAVKPVQIIPRYDCPRAFMRFFHNDSDLDTWICTLPVGQVKVGVPVTLNPPIRQ